MLLKLIILFFNYMLEMRIRLLDCDFLYEFIFFYTK